MATPKKITLADGTVKYRIVFDAGRDPETGKRRQLTRTFGKLKEANAELARASHQRATGAYVPPSKLTLNAMLDGWLESATFEKEAATRSNYEHALRPARERLGGRLVQSITREDIEDLRNWMLMFGRKRGGKPGTGLGPLSVRLTLSRLGAAFDQALDDCKLTRNPVARVKRPKLVKRQRETWSAEEARTFLAAAADDRLYVAWLLAMCGLRREEICGLRWPDVSLDAETLTIAGVRVVVDGKVIVKHAPKSERSARTLPLLPGMPGAFTALRKRQAAEKLAAGPAYQAGLGGLRWYIQAADGILVPIKATGDYVVTDELGLPVNPEWFSDEFGRLVKRAGLPRMTPHGARRTANSLMEKAAVPKSIRSAWCGHTEEVNESAYVYARPDDLAVARDALSRVYGVTGS